MSTTGTSNRSYRVALVKRRAAPELLTAWETGAVSLKFAYRTCHFSSAKQRAQLAKYLETRRENDERQTAWRSKPNRGARSMYASASYAETKARRLRRLKRYAIPELIAAYDSVQLSLRAAELLSRLPSRQQRTQLANRLQSQRQKDLGERLAAEAIGEYLQDQRGRIQLNAVLDRIIEAIRCN